MPPSLLRVIRFVTLVSFLCSFPALGRLPKFYPSLLRSEGHSSQQQDSTAEHVAPVLNTNPLEGLEWAMLVDGKDAKKGPHAYDEHGMQESLHDALQFALSSESGNFTENAKMIHQKCCDGKGFRDKTCFCPIESFWERCFLAMSCKEQQAALSDVPTDLFVTLNYEKDSCELEGIRSAAVDPAVASDRFFNLIQNHEQTTRQLLLEGASFELKLTALAKTMRQLAWQHPYSDFNGRFRTLLLQHEIRRLGLGNGAFMYNNNRDVFHINLDTYKLKIIEGLKMYNLSMQIKSNAWLDETNVRKHFEQFPVPAGGTCEDGGTSGDISFANYNSHVSNAFD